MREEEEIREKLRETKKEIHREWAAFKRYHGVMHGTEFKDNAIDMLLLFLIRKGIFNDEE